MTKGQDKRIQYLVNEIKRHRYLYYNQQPEISDAKYDTLDDELRDLDPENPILFKIGVDSSELFTKREHIIPMTSQDKVVDPKDFLKWTRKRNYKLFLIQFKLDGISIELQYTDGTFHHAVTRGDGIKGDDVSANVINMKGFVPKINVSFTGAVRAEILLLHDIYEKKYSDKQNCRNAAAGIVRRKDGVGSGDLNLIYYDVISLSDDVVFTTEIQKLKWLKDQGFDTVRTKTVDSPQAVIEVREDVVKNIISTLEYDIDGLVIKGKEIDLEDMKRVRPMKQIAFKFWVEGIEATLIDVEWSINGHNYTPVGKLDKVHYLGSDIENPNLSNLDKIQRLGIKIPCEVIVSKGGLIIPDVLQVIKVFPNSVDVEPPTICEVCMTPLQITGSRVFCPNKECPKRYYHRLKKWLEALSVKHFGEESILKKLFDIGMVNKIADFYSLKVSDLTQFEGVAEKSAKKALDNLFAIKEVPLSTFIAGFDIDNFGEGLTQLVVEAGYNTLDKIKNTSISQLTKVKGIGLITSQYLLDGIHELYSDMLDVLNTNKINIKEESYMKGKLDKKSFCVTGSLINFKNRDEIHDLITQHGGIVKKRVVKDLSYLITNSTEPTEKYKDAQEQGTEIITEHEFLDMIKE